MRRALLAVLALLLAACAPGPVVLDDPAPAPNGQARAELAANRARWAGQGPSAYVYRFTNDCGECSPEMRDPRPVAVSGGKIISVETRPDLLTVDEIFVRIEQALNGGSQVRVRYDGELGYPRDVEIDMHLRPVDGGTHWQVEALQPLLPVTNAGQLAEAHDLWTKGGLTSYSFVMRVVCDCPEGGTFGVDVVGRRVFEVRPLDEAAEQSFFTPPSMEETFDDFAEWFDDPDSLALEGIVDVSILADPVLGFPRWVSVSVDDLDEVISGGRFTIEATIDSVEALDQSVIDPGPDPAQDRARLEHARRRWEVLQPSHYRYTLTNHCMCPPEYTGPFQIEVKDGRVVAATWNGESLAPDQGPAPTIEEAYALIEQFIDAGKTIEVTYHPDLGYPQLAVLDTEAVAVDGGLSFSIEGLTSLEVTSGIAGLVIAGPVCPVQKDPPDPDCADRPVVGAVMVVLDPTGKEVARAVSDEEGWFSLALEPGSYRVVPQSVEGLLGTAAPFELEVSPGMVEQVTVGYDTGMR